MIKRDIRYIIKRILIGVGITLLLGFIGSCQVRAETYLQTTTLNFASTDANTQHEVFTSTNTFKNFGRGYLTFNFVYYRSSDTTSFQVPSAKEVQVTAGSNIYVCELGTFSQDFDSNYDNLKMNFYTAVCDVNLQNEGLTKISIINANGVNNQYTLKTSQYMTFSSNLEFEIRSYMATINSTLANYLGTINSTISSYISTTNDLTNRINNLLQTNIPLILQAIQNSQTAIINNQNTNTNSITNAQNNTTNAIDGVNDSINDSSTDDPTNDLNSMKENETSNSVISDLLLLPITLYQNILNNINGTCSAFSLGSLLGTNLTMPCINVSEILGSHLYGVIDIILSGLFILSIRKKFVDIFENISSLKDRGNELE